MGTTQLPVSQTAVAAQSVLSEQEVAQPDVLHLNRLHATAVVTLHCPLPLQVSAGLNSLVASLQDDAAQRVPETVCSQLKPPLAQLPVYPQGGDALQANRQQMLPVPPASGRQFPLSQAVPSVQAPPLAVFWMVQVPPLQV